jgi:hypothetical protein
MGCLHTDRLSTGAVICKLFWQLVLKASEGDVSLQLQGFLQFVPVMGSRELEGKTTKGGIGFRGDQ